jgi:hypothetical protein
MLRNSTLEGPLNTSITSKLVAATSVKMKTEEEVLETTRINFGISKT